MYGIILKNFLILIFKYIFQIPLIVFLIFFCNEIFSENLKKDLKLGSNNESLMIEKRLYKNGKDKENIEIYFSDLYPLLIKQNKELKILRSQIEQNIYNFKAEKSSWYPTLGITSSEFPKLSTGSNFDKFSSPQDTFTKKLDFGMSLNLEWDLVKPARRLDIDIAFEKVSNSKLNYENKIKELFLETSELFFLIQESSQNIKISKKSLEISSLALEEASNRFKAGIGNKLNVLEAETQYGRDKISLVKRIGELKLNENKLSIILNLMPNQIPVIKEEPKILSIWNSSFKESLDSALIFREDIKIQKSNIQINEKQALSILSGKKPSIKIYNTYSTSSSSGQSGVEYPNYANSSNSEDNAVGVKFSWNLFDGGLIKNSYKSIKDKTIELEETYQLKIDQLEKDIKDSFINLEVYKENIIESYNQQESAKESLFLALRRLEAGLTTQREVVNNQGDVTEAESNFINSITDYNKIILKLTRLTGLDPIGICLVSKESNDYFLKFVLNNNLSNKCDIENKNISS